MIRPNINYERNIMKPDESIEITLPKSREEKMLSNSDQMVYHAIREKYNARAEKGYKVLLDAWEINWIMAKIGEI